MSVCKFKFVLSIFFIILTNQSSFCQFDKLLKAVENVEKVAKEVETQIGKSPQKTSTMPNTTQKSSGKVLMFGEENEFSLRETENGCILYDTLYKIEGALQKNNAILVLQGIKVDDVEKIWLDHKMPKQNITTWYDVCEDENCKCQKRQQERGELIDISHFKGLRIYDDSENASKIIWSLFYQDNKKYKILTFAEKEIVNSTQVIENMRFIDFQIYQTDGGMGVVDFVRTSGYNGFQDWPSLVKIPNLTIQDIVNYSKKYSYSEVSLYFSPYCGEDMCNMDWEEQAWAPSGMKHFGGFYPSKSYRKTHSTYYAMEYDHKTKKYNYILKNSKDDIDY